MICRIASRYTANTTTLNPYISQTIGDVESIIDRKMIQDEILDRISVLKFLSHDLKIEILPP